MAPNREPDRTRLLLVEDDPAMRDLMVEVLSDAGYDVKATGGGSKAILELFRPPGLGGYDVVVTDLRMPGMDGIELLRLIRDIGGPPVVLVSAFATPDVREEALEAGVVEVVSKPFEAAFLLSSIERASGRAC